MSAVLGWLTGQVEALGGFPADRWPIGPRFFTRHPTKQPISSAGSLLPINPTASRCYGTLEGGARCATSAHWGERYVGHGVCMLLLETRCTRGVTYTPGLPPQRAIGVEKKRSSSRSLVHETTKHNLLANAAPTPLRMGKRRTLRVLSSSVPISLVRRQFARTCSTSALGDGPSAFIAVHSSNGSFC